MYLVSPAMDTIVGSGACMVLIGLLMMSVRSRTMESRYPQIFCAYPAGANGQAISRSDPGFRMRRSASADPSLSRFKRKASEEVWEDRAKSWKEGNSAARLVSPLHFAAAAASTGAPEESATSLFMALQPAVTTEGSIPAFLPPIQEKQEIVAESSAILPVLTEKFDGAAVSSAVEDTSAVEPKEPKLEFSATPKNPDGADLLSFHGLKQQPFDVTPDPAFLYFSPSHHEALLSLSQGIENCRGFMALIAEPGMGKTTLLNKLMEELGDSARIVFLFQTQCTSSQLLAFILNELEIDHSDMDVVAMHRALNNALMGEMLLGRRFVLIVDEAQNLQDSVLETIRLLSDFETTHSKLVQIVLAGQPQLAETLMRPGLAQLRQRIADVSRLQPLSDMETAEYVEHRLRAGGWNANMMFTPEALAAVAEASKGVPRNINNICFNALQVAYLQGEDTIDSDIVKKVVAKLDLGTLVARSPRQTISRPADALPDRNATVQLARALIAALSSEGRPNAHAEASTQPKSRTGVVVSGTVTDVVRTQSWGKRNEYRIQVSLERDLQAGVAHADRYYCCNLYVNEEQAAMLHAGKPVRIRLEQD